MGTTAEKLQYLNTTKANIRTAINNHGGDLTEQDTFRSYSNAIESVCIELERYKNAFPYAIAEGESLTLEDSAELPYKLFNVKGKSEQDGTPTPSNPVEIHSVADDVNLLPYPYKDTTNSPITSNGVTWNDNGGGTITANGTPTGLTQFIIKDINDPISVLPNTTYTLSGGSLDNGVVLSFTEYDNSNNVITTHDNVTIKTFTTSSSTTKLVGILKRRSNSISINNFTIKPKLQKGSTPTPYSPYNQGTVTIKQRGKNLFNKEAVAITSGGTKTVLDTGIRVSLSSSGTFRSCGIEIGKEELLGKTLTVYSEITPSSNNNGAIFLYYGNSSNMAVSNAYANITSTGSLTKTLVSEFPTNCDRVYALFYGNRDGTGNIDDYIDYTNVQIEQGSTATDYEPYFNENYTFQTAPLRSLPNGVKDTIEADGIHRRVGRVVLDGTEDYISFTTQTNSNYVFLLREGIKQNANGLSNYFIRKNCYTEDKVGIWFTPYSTSLIQINFPTSISTLADWKTWLSTHNTEVLYELAEEVIEPLTEEQSNTMIDIISTGTYKDVTYLDSEEIKPTLEVQYYIRQNR